VHEAQAGARSEVVSTVVSPSSTKRRSATRPVDAIGLLKADHRSIESLFKRFESSGERAFKTKQKLIDRVISELSVHAFIEEEVLYPTAKKEIAAAKGDVLEAIEEHHVVKWQLQELTDLDPADERFTPKVTVLAENVRHHVKEEERELFLLLRSSFERTRLLELAAELEKAKRVAPKHPHPRIPPNPSEHLIPEAVASVIDRAKSAVKKASN
jgi:hemerythrin-like domain-containing protein